MSDTIAVMNEGKIVQTGSPDHIYDHPDNLFTADFIGAGNFIKINSVKNTNGMLELISKKGGIFRSSCVLPDTTRDKDPVFFIRPEKIKISHGSSIDANTFTGKIISSVFEGPDIRLELDSPELGKVRMEIKNDGTPFNYRKSNELTFYWNLNDGMLLFKGSFRS
jgi:ABC-type Fe3+/spermidine/putrescine transport system ATPase subunit